MERHRNTVPTPHGNPSETAHALNRRITLAEADIDRAWQLIESATAARDRYRAQLMEHAACHYGAMAEGVRA